MKNNKSIFYLLFGSAIGLFLGIKGTSDIISFFESIIGGIIGGLFTLIGVQKTIDLQIEKEERETLPRKVVTIEEMNDDLYVYIKEFNRIRKIIYQWEDNIAKGNLEEGITFQGILKESFLNVFEVQFRELKTNMLKMGATVDVETFEYAREFFEFIKGQYDGLKNIIPSDDSKLPDSFYDLVQGFYQKSGHLKSFLDKKSEFYKSKITNSKIAG